MQQENKLNENSFRRDNSRLKIQNLNNVYINLNNINIRDTTNFTKISFNEFIEIIENGEWNDINVPSSKNIEETWYFTTSEFKRRDRRSLIEYQPLFCFDLDKKDNEDIDIELLINELKNDEYIFCIYRTISGGIRFFIYYDNKEVNETKHNYIYNEILNVYEDLYSINLDRSCSDISRAFYIFPDKYIYSSENKFNLSNNNLRKLKKEIKKGMKTKLVILDKIYEYCSSIKKFEHGKRNDFIYYFSLQCKKNNIEIEDVIDYCIDNNIISSKSVVETENTIKSAYKRVININEEIKKIEFNESINEYKEIDWISLYNFIKKYYFNEDEYCIDFDSFLSRPININTEHKYFYDFINLIKTNDKLFIKNLIEIYLKSSKSSKSSEIFKKRFEIFIEYHESLIPFHSNEREVKKEDLNSLKEIVRKFLIKNVQRISWKGEKLIIGNKVYPNNNNRDLDIIINNISIILRNIYDITLKYSDIKESLLSVKVEQYNPLDELMKEIRSIDLDEAIKRLNELKEYYKDRFIDNEDFWRKVEFWGYKSIRQYYDINFANEHQLIFYSKTQGTGKSYLVEVLTNCFNKLNLMADDVADERETKRNSLYNFIIFDDELSSRNKKEIEFYKKILTSKVIDFNEKYKVENDRGRRISNFIACTNNNMIIKENKSRRDLIVKFREERIKSDFIRNGYKYLEEDYSVYFWRVMIDLYEQDKKNGCDYFISMNEKINESVDEVNEDFKIISYEEDLITNYFEPVKKDELKNYNIYYKEKSKSNLLKDNKSTEDIYILQLNDIINIINEKNNINETFNKNYFIKILNKLEFEQNKNFKLNNKTISGYIVKMI